MKKRIVIALGGNAISPGIGSPTAKNQQQACREAAKSLLQLIQDGHGVILTHGNGPQVGAMLLQNEASDQENLPAMPLDTLVASTQGQIGYWLQNAFTNLFIKEGITKPILSLITQVEVSQNDPAFQNPTKFVGPFYNQEEAKTIEAQKGYLLKEDSGRGYRRVVPSPQPISIVEQLTIENSLKEHLVIASGGGGIPVVKDENGMYQGVEAVIDKDLASEKLAEGVGADVLIILTAVEHVCLNFGKPTERPLYAVTVEELERAIENKEFAPGSMLPKVKAGIEFVKSKPGRMTIITSLEKANQVFEPKVGTKISLS